MRITLIFLLLVNFLYAQNYPVSSIDNRLRENATAVIRAENTNIIIHSINHIEYQIEHVKTILTKDAQHFALPYIPYSKGDKISKVKVTLYDQSGQKKRTFSKSDFKDYSSNSEGTFYSDSRVLVLPFVPSEYPYTIAVSYVYKTENTVFIPDFIPFRSKQIALEKSRLNIQNLSGIKLRLKTYESPFHYTTVSINEKENEKTLTYENVPAIADEPLVPDVKRILPRVSFALEQFNLEGKKGAITSWKDFGTWYYQSIIQPVEVSTPEIKSEIAALHLSGTTEEKVKKIYQFMQSKTRYIFVALGIGGWQPMLPGEVQKKGYGDCKGLTNYMKTLLDEAGIPSYYAIINSGRSPISFDKDFPKMAGNHVILMVPTENGTIWLENTSQNFAFNHLSMHTTNRNVLAIKPEGIAIVDTPVYDANMNKEIQDLQVKMNEDLSIDVKGQFSYTGSQYDYNLGLMNLNQEERIKRMRGVFNMINFETLDIQNVDNNRDIAQLRFNLNFKSGNYAKSLGNSMLFRAVPIYSNSFYHHDKERTLPFEISNAYQDEYQITYQFPTGYEIEELAENVNLKSEFGVYRLTFQKQDGQLIVKRYIRINKGLFPKEKYNAYVFFRNAITNSDNSKILITKP